MAISVKGIQYSYQIDFFNQVPTRLKSQIHDLPVLSVQRPTPVDENTSNDANVPYFEQHQSFAGVRAASTGIPQETGQTINPAQTGNDKIAAAPLPSAPLNDAVDFGLKANTANLSSAQTIIQIKPDPELNLNRQKQLPTENLSVPIASQPQFNTRTSPAVEVEDFPVADRSPSDPVKGIPRYQFLLAQRAYQPNFGSYLQPQGYENPMQAGAVNDPVEVTAPTRPLTTPNIPGNQDSRMNSAVEPAVQIATEKGQTATQPVLENNATEKEAPPDVAPLVIAQNFVSQQAQKLYEVFANAALLSESSKVDFYF